jgi:LPS-assembly protein
MSMPRYSLMAGLCLGALILLQPVLSPAQEALEINMDELIDDMRNQRVVARGNVEIRFYGEVLMADEVIYDRATRKLTARGRIELQEADGKITKADAMNLHETLRDAFVTYARRQKIRIDR